MMTSKLNVTLYGDRPQGLYPLMRLDMEDIAVYREWVDINPLTWIKAVRISMNSIPWILLPWEN